MKVRSALYKQGNVTFLTTKLRLQVRDIKLRNRISLTLFLSYFNEILNIYLYPQCVSTEMSLLLISKYVPLFLVTYFFVICLKRFMLKNKWRYKIHSTTM